MSWYIKWDRIIRLSLFGQTLFLNQNIANASMPQTRAIDGEHVNKSDSLFVRETTGH